MNFFRTYICVLKLKNGSYILKMAKRGQELLIIGSVWPEPQSSAAGQRMMQLIRLLQAEGWNITFGCSAAKTDHMVELADYGIKTSPIQINSSTFDAFISELEPSVVMFDRFITEEQFGWRVAEQCPQALRILDTEDLHCLRRTRRKAVEQGIDLETNHLLTDDTAKREVASILRSDVSLIISEYEMELLQNVFKVDSSLLLYLPFLIDAMDENDMRQWPDYEERSGFITIGNFRHAPNMDGVRYLKEQIWPLIREELPREELHIYGAYPSQEAQKLYQPQDGFYIKGRARDAEKVMKQARVCLAPLRFGAGLKGKLTKAMQCGTPSVTTPIGAEGIAGGLDWPGVVAESPKKLAAAAVELHENARKWGKAQGWGMPIINERFNLSEHQPRFVHKIEKLKENLETHRLQNFTGAMLRHHQAASTKYMNRWIEEKNKN